MKQRKLLALIGSICLIVAMVACAAPVPAPTPAPAPPPTPVPAPAPAPEYEWPAVMKLGVTAIGGSSYASAAAWGIVMEQDTGMKIRLVPERSTVIQGRWLKEGKVDTTFNTPSVEGPEAMEAECGTGWDTRDGGPYQTRTVWLSNMSWWGFMVRGDSDIKTIYDIKPGTRIAYFTGSAGCVKTTFCLLDWLQLKKEDIVEVPIAGFGASVKSVAEGKADVIYASTVASATFEAEANPHGIRWLPLDPKEDPEGYGRFKKNKRGVTLGVCPKGVKSAIGIPMIISPFVMCTTADKDTEFIYHLAKWLHENFDAYKDKHPNCPQMSIELFRDWLDISYLPVHDGTIKYLKEVGIWTADDDARQKYNVDLVDKYIKAYAEAIKAADEQEIMIESKGEKWCELWAGFKKDLPHFDVMYEVPE